MSSILKALRKVEDEKATMGEGSVDLAHDILRRTYDDRPENSWRKIAFFCVFFVVITAVAGWWYWSSKSIVQVSTPDIQVITSELVLPKEQPPQAVEQVPSPPTAKSIPSPSRSVETTNSPIITAEKQVEIIKKSSDSEPLDTPQLKVEEIIYHSEPMSRLAIINDLPVMVGTDIDGVRVEEILPDQVRFSFQGVSFSRFKVQD